LFLVYLLAKEANHERIIKNFMGKDRYEMAEVQEGLLRGRET
jgi:hypothetical protein